MITPEINKQFEEIQVKLKRLEAQEQKQLLQEQFIKKLAAKNIPVHFVRGRAIENVEQIDIVIKGIEAEY